MSRIWRRSHNMVLSYNILCMCMCCASTQVWTREHSTTAESSTLIFRGWKGDTIQSAVSYKPSLAIRTPDSVIQPYDTTWAIHWISYRHCSTVKSVCHSLRTYTPTNNLHNFLVTYRYMIFHLKPVWIHSGTHKRTIPVYCYTAVHSCQYLHCIHWYLQWLKHNARISIV